MRYNIIQRLYIPVLGLTIFLTGTEGSFGQQVTESTAGLPVIASVSLYQETVKKDSNQRMINVQTAIPAIILDLRYAGDNNFMMRTMYTEKPGYTFLRSPAVKALAMAEQALNKTGYGLKIFDAYRPYFVTQKFWELVHDERYVADPKKGSGHNRGIAIDLTIIDLKTKQELKMPTGFDNFTDSAHHDFMNLSAEVLKNRKLLKDTMEKYGFKAFDTEWWHYSLPNPERFEVLDLKFEALKNAGGK